MSDRPEAIRIDDLASPVLTPFQRQAVEGARGRPVDLSVAAVLEAAVAQTGLTDFGPEDFRERLAVQLQSAAEDDWLNDFGRQGVFGAKVHQAVTRLRCMDALRRHPEIDSIRIERPLIIAGLPRSGTTHLLNMLAADTRFRSMPFWESRQPVPGPDEPVTRDRRDPRYLRCAQAYAVTDQLLPYMKNMHDMHPEHIHEDIELLDIDFSSYTLEWSARVPRWRDYYLSHDQTPHYAFLKRMLRLLSFYSGTGLGEEAGGDLRPRRWVTKTPQHLEQLVPLARNFPDACFLVTHRDPVEVASSTMTLVAYMSRTRNDRIHLREIADYWLDRIERLLRACLRDRRLLPAERAFDVSFPAFMADDMAMIRRIYEFTGTPMTAQAQRQLEDYLRDNPRGKHGQVIYEIEKYFGLRIADLRDRFDFYYREYPELDPRRR
jgi:hypothetical protein